ncbi:SDR family oxidoreductase [Aureitalea marina]|uniref:LPS biosynthesis protein WbpP n=1 Tax=Aureitalea marina TaxID=930804 RepID=A0A2S7KML0_9FLAO|nr:SDR family oxidoreductase [Aureitalea marina]PQB03869.1 LPS biosynthesis protein WbpP [Aureitalea marina]
MYQNKFHTEDITKLSFLITGGAGFIGSNLVEYLLNHKAGKVRVLDNLATGSEENIREFFNHPSFEYIEGDIRDLETCREAMSGIDFVSHQAALGSVPRSLDDPLTSHEVNVTGFVNMLIAQKESSTVKRMVYAASSSTYGDSLELPKVEDRIGNPLSPYAVTKLANEIYSDVFCRSYGIETVGLRYFNVFGPKQSPDGPYAAVIPLFMQALKDNVPPTIHGDGDQTRDFTFVENAVQANIRAFFAGPEAANQVYNVACGQRISLNELWEQLQQLAGIQLKAHHGPARKGDVRDSLAQIDKAKKYLNYNNLISCDLGLQITWDHFYQD